MESCDQVSDSIRLCVDEPEDTEPACPDDTASVHSTTDISSARRPNIIIELLSEEQTIAHFSAEISRWPSHVIGDAKRTVHKALSLVKAAAGGCLLVVGPEKELKRLSLQSTDNGYLKSRLQKLSVHDPEFGRIFEEFAQHSENDRWPDDYYDHEGRGRPKDGAILLFPHGKVAKCACKIMGLPVSEHQWAGHGTRHETALQLASYLNHSISIIKSSSGSLHCLLSTIEGYAYQLVVDADSSNQPCDVQSSASLPSDGEDESQTPRRRTSATLDCSPISVQSLSSESPDHEMREGITKCDGQQVDGFPGMYSLSVDSDQSKTKTSLLSWRVCPCERRFQTQHRKNA